MKEKDSELEELQTSINKWRNYYLLFDSYEPTIQDWEQWLGSVQDMRDYFFNQGFLFCMDVPLFKGWYLSEIQGITPESIMETRSAEDLEFDQKDFNKQLEKGLSFFNSKNYDEALKCFTHCIELEVGIFDMAAVYFNRGMIHMEQHNYEQAIDDLNKARGFDPFKEAILFQRALAYTRNRQFIKALQDLENIKGSEFKPSFIEDCKKELQENLTNYIINVHNLTGKEEQLFSYFQGVYYQDNEDFITAIDKYSKFIDEYSKFIDNRPNSSYYLEALWHRGHCFGKVNEYKKAILDYDLLGQMSCEGDGYYHGDIYSWISELYLKSDDYDMALKCIDYSISKVNNYKYHLIKARIWKEKKSFDKAFHCCTKSIELNSGFIDSYVLRGQIRSELEDYDGAIHDISCAIEKNPNEGEYYYNRAKMNYKLRETRRSSRIIPNSLIIEDLKIASDFGIKKADEFLESLK